MISLDIQQQVAWLAVVILAGMSVFQLLLAAGMPLGRFAWGGQYQRLPAKLRFASFISAGILVFGGMCVLERAALRYYFDSQVMVQAVVWILVAMFALSAFGNIISKSSGEKHLMTPVATVLTVSCLIVALGP